MLDKTKKVISVIILIILIPILFVNGVILVNSFLHPDEIPSFFGWKPFIVLSGSMETEICSGDLAIVKEVDTNFLKENDIIAFKQDDFVTTHRIVKIIEENGIRKYKTKGDNNNIEDSEYILEEQIEGLYQFKIEGLGNLAMFTQTPIGMIVCLSIPICIILLIQKTDSKKNKEDAKNNEQQLKEEIERLKQQNEKLLKK